jgi:hypothetical protein
MSVAPFSRRLRRIISFDPVQISRKPSARASTIVDFEGASLRGSPTPWQRGGME